MVEKNFHTVTHTDTRHPDWLSRASQHARGATKNEIIHETGSVHNIGRITLLPQEDRATGTCNIHRKFVEVKGWFLRYALFAQTDTPITTPQPSRVK